MPEYNVSEDTREVDLIVSIDEDRPMKVRRLLVTGNEKTRDKVVRREVRVNETDLVNTKLLRRSFQRINNLNFFESIEITPARVGTDEVDLSIRVKEKSTGALSIGGGYSSVDRLVALAEITQGNLFGRGQLIRARAEMGGRRNTYSFTFREPYLFDKPVSGTISAFNQVRDFNSYQERRVGGNLILGKSFSEYFSGSLSYTLESLNIFDIDPVDAPSLIIEQGGETVTSSLGNTLAYDSRDFIFDPSTGTHVVASVEYAGTFLRGDNNFVKGVLDISRFFPLPLGTVFSAHGKVGLATGIQGTALPVGERFFVGGINSVRGFDFGEAGPIDEETGEIIGGTKELIFNLEFLFP
ncbi:MAG TPA: BamA/TamA family outer membrane protein, partial [Nitrospiria bacterium]|nr:BamA/TamA family outer membrane protein [Nitrospiria bacterium]